MSAAPFDIATMVADDLAAGVVWVHADDVQNTDHTATNAGIVLGEKAVLVVESLRNARLAGQLLAHVRRRTRLPIRYLVNTSYHGDHCFGNFLFPPDTVLIQHAATRRHLLDHFEDDRAFMGAGRGIEEVAPRPADLTTDHGLTVDLGGRLVSSQASELTARWRDP